MAHLRHTAPTIEDMERQKRWEGECINRGVKRYREMLSEASTAADTQPGQMVIKEVMRSLIPALQAKEKEAIESIAAGGAGRQPEWWWMLPLLPADHWAFFALRAVFSDPFRDMGTHHKVTTVSLAAVRYAQLQLDYDRWTEAEKVKAKAAKKEAERARGLGVAEEEIPRHVNFFEALKRNAKRIDARAFSRWSKKIGRVKDEPWDKEVCIQLGTLLLELLAEHSGGWFEIKLVPIAGGKTERHIIITELGMKAMNDLNERKEVARPVLMPMVCKPKAWVLAQA